MRPVFTNDLSRKRPDSVLMASKPKGRLDNEKPFSGKDTERDQRAAEELGDRGL